MNHNRYLDFSVDYNEAKIVLLLSLITLTLFQRVRSYQMNKLAFRNFPWFSGLSMFLLAGENHVVR